MKKTGIFLGGFATGVVVTFVILLIIGLAQNSSAITGVQILKNQEKLFQENHLKYYKSLQITQH